MRAARGSAVAVAEVSAPRKPAPSDELVFDFSDVFDAPQPKRVQQSWLKESGGVKAAILRWLEEQA